MADSNHDDYSTDPWEIRNGDYHDVKYRYAQVGETTSSFTSFGPIIPPNPFLGVPSEASPVWPPGVVVPGTSGHQQTPAYPPPIKSNFNEVLSSISGSSPSSPVLSGVQSEHDDQQLTPPSSDTRAAICPLHLSLPQFGGAIVPHQAPGDYNQIEGAQDFLLMPRATYSSDASSLGDYPRTIVDSDLSIPNGHEWPPIFQSMERMHYRRSPIPRIKAPRSLSRSRSRSVSPLRRRRVDRLHNRALATSMEQVDWNLHQEEGNGQGSITTGPEISFGGLSVDKHTCTICGQVLAPSTKMRDHLATHSNERPHACNTCEATFKTRREVSRHSRTHDNRRRFYCTTCGSSFSRRDNHTRHTRTQHAEDSQPFDMLERYSCSGCHRRFEDVDAFETHNREYHAYHLCQWIDEFQNLLNRGNAGVANANIGSS